MLETIEKAWGWIGLRPVEVVASNAFGNVIVADQTGAYWRICPEELSCEVIADSKQELDGLFGDEEFVTDWEMASLVELARARYGPLAADRCYCLKMPGVLGGEYVSDNLGTNSRLEVIAFSGDVAEQIKDVPEGGTVEIEII